MKRLRAPILAGLAALLAISLVVTALRLSLLRLSGRDEPVIDPQLAAQPEVNP